MAEEFEENKSAKRNYSLALTAKSDCIYHAPIGLEQQTDSVRLLFQINRKMVNTI